MTKKAVTKITKLVINRATWGERWLLSPSDSKMCCLGFLALACGAAPDEIESECRPGEVPNIDWPAEFIESVKDHDYKNKLTIMSNALAKEAMTINDSPLLGGAEKEKQLIKLFKKAGIKLSFEG